MSTTMKTLNNIHHAAYRCRDAEQTRWFYEEVLGLPLTVALVEERDFGLPEDNGEPRKFMHLFFELRDGNFIAFFDQPGACTEADFARADSFDRHIAIEADSHEELLAWQARINSKGKSCLGPVDHGFCDSVYMYDPNGLQVEICAKKPEYVAIMKAEADKVEAMMAEWTETTRAQKEAKFGKAALEKR